MPEKTEYRERHDLEYEAEQHVRDNLQELEARLTEKTNDRAPMVWPGDYWNNEADSARTNFHELAREWWWKNENALDPVEIELRLYDQEQFLAQRKLEAHGMGIRMAETIQEMMKDYQDLGYRVSPEEARLFSEKAAGKTIHAQQIIGHPVQEKLPFQELDAHNLQRELESYLEQHEGRYLEPRKVGNIFARMESILQYGERIQALEVDPTYGEIDPLDRYTRELVDWAIREGEFHHWTEGRKPGFDLTGTSEKLFDLHLEQDNRIQEEWGRAPDPGMGVPEHVMKWAAKGCQAESWVRDYQEVLEALSGNQQDDLPPGP